MKKIFVFLLLLFSFSSSIFAQLIWELNEITPLIYDKNIRPDSISIERDDPKLNSYKLFYTYDDEGNLAQYKSSRLDSTCNCWVDYNKNQYTKREYQKQYNLLTTEYYSFNNQMWEAVSKQQEIQDKNDKIIYYLYSEWDAENNKWNEQSESDYIYKKNQLTNKYTSKWNIEKNDWDLTNVTTNKYKGKQKIRETKLTLLKQAFYHPDSKTEWKYSKNQTIETKYERMVKTCKWELSEKKEFIFNDSGKEISKTTYRWNKEKGKWNKRFLETTNYDEKGKVNSKLKSRWNEKSGEWQKSEESFYTYNENRELLTETFYKFDSASRRMKLFHSEKRTYDNNNRIIEYSVEKLPYKEIFEINTNTYAIEWEQKNPNKNKTEFTYDDDNNTITAMKYYDGKLLSKVTFYYSSKTIFF